MGSPNGILEMWQDIRESVVRESRKKSLEAKQQLTGFISTTGDIVISTKLCV